MEGEGNDEGLGRGGRGGRGRRDYKDCITRKDRSFMTK